MQSVNIENRIVLQSGAMGEEACGQEKSTLERDQNNLRLALAFDRLGKKRKKKKEKPRGIIRLTGKTISLSI